MAGENTTLKYEEVCCPGCNNILKYYDVKDSAWFGCPTCNTFFRQGENDESPVEIKTFHKDYAYERLLNFGDEGFLHERKFIVTGYIYKYVVSDALYWDEYLLYSPDEDRNFVLVHVDGDWFFIWLADQQNYEIREDFESGEPYLFLQSYPYRSFPLHTSYKFDILYAAGEFDENIIDQHQTLTVEEYVAMPNIIVSETMNGQTTWYKGAHFYTWQVRNAFSKEVRDRFPETFEDRFENKWPSVKRITLVAFVLLLVTQFLFIGMRDNKMLVNKIYQTTLDSASWGMLPVDAGTIAINGPAVVNFIIEANINNEWLEVGITLTEIKTGKVFEFTKALEFYNGVEGGESWSEGSRSTSGILSSVPTGTYQVNIYPYAHSAKVFDLELTIEQNTVLYSNLFIAMLCILLYPALMLFRKNSIDNWKTLGDY